MKQTEIHDLIKFVAKAGVTEVEIEHKDFKITIKSEMPKKGKKGSDEPIIQQIQVPVATPVMQAAPVAAAPAGGGAAPAEEKSDFTIFLASAGDKKINVIKEVRAITGLGLKEAKDLVEGAPKEVKSGVNKKEAEEIKAKLEAAGATVELK